MSTVLSPQGTASTRPDSAFERRRTVLRYLLVTSGVVRDPIIVLTFLSSLSRTGLMYSINETAQNAEKGVSLWSLGIMACALAMLTLGYVLRIRIHKLITRVRETTRIRLARTLLRADIDFLQNSPHGQVHSALTHEIDQMSGAIVNVIETIEALVIVVFVVPYLFWISWTSGIATMAAIAVGILGYQFFDRPARRSMVIASNARAVFFDRARDLLSGWKELRLRNSRRQSLEAETIDVIGQVTKHTITAEKYYAASSAIGQAAVVLLLCFVVIVIPLLPGGGVAVMFQVLTVIFLTSGPIEMMFNAFPVLSRAEHAYYRIQAVEEALINAQSSALDGPVEVPDGFTEIRLEHIAAKVGEDDGHGGEAFQLGPIDLSFKPGETVFICGGNGSGKTTLLDIITGLRHPDSGELILDGTPLNAESRASYRELFSSVFSSFHLFSRAYGLGEEELAQLQQRIEDMNLSGRVSILEDRFSTLALSAGQKRRLALSVALAERRPIIVLDEFAADQDPAHRAFFYDVLIPELSRGGQLVIAITHDDHQFHKCDRLIKMADGKIESIITPEPRA
ncbi:MAG: cyclic peptide export ABC transporter [Rhodobacteraceae bacterium]|nr:cyclic peptide export ABC transporter [Paracoccaceae bacterium]